MQPHPLAVSNEQCRNVKLRNLAPSFVQPVWVVNVARGSKVVNIFNKKALRICKPESNCGPNGDDILVVLSLVIKLQILV